MKKFKFILFSILLAFSVLSCQEENFGYTASDIRYNTEFVKEFGNPDPNHTWMCNPDTVYITPSTRAYGDSFALPVLQSEVKTYTWDEVNSALDYMEEGRDNRDQCAQNFEYLAVTETEYSIIPVFWGRKFCTNNEIGLYYIGTDDKPHNLEAFWSDINNNIRTYCSYRNCAGQSLTNTEYAITNRDDRNRLRHLHNNRNYDVTKYDLPIYTFTVPEGVMWGIYLRTNKTQANGSSHITWYSNASFNDDKVSAAATFTYANVTYCSFEDAPHNLHGRDQDSGNCSCGYGHYDFDYNDIVLAITPRPIESTYKIVKYRVMCEDLGGTWDWDFNDIVFDVVDESTSDEMQVYVQAVGGTLPVRLKYKEITTEELHQHTKGQQPVEGLYEPINVKGKRETLNSKILHFPKIKTETDIRNYMKDLSVLVNNHTEIKFPDKEGNNTPQCFITSTGTEWPDESQNINDKYSEFSNWVKSQSSAENWWKTNPNF